MLSSLSLCDWWFLDISFARGEEVRKRAREVEDKRGGEERRKGRKGGKEERWRGIGEEEKRRG